ncbi:hypothetical protein D3C74_462960 [compost metagenome]
MLRCLTITLLPVLLWSRLSVTLPRIRWRSCRSRLSILLRRGCLLPSLRSWRRRKPYTATVTAESLFCADTAAKWFTIR